MSFNFLTQCKFLFHTMSLHSCAFADFCIDTRSRDLHNKTETRIEKKKKFVQGKIDFQFEFLPPEQTCKILAVFVVT